jgi:polyferredoxin
MKPIHQRISQIIATLLYNSYLSAFLVGTIYQGNLKYFNCPGFNCYSCPSAIFSCPIGIIQFFVAYGPYCVSFYTLGIIGIIGALGGRIVCGWACPFGFLQDLLFKIRSPKLRIPRLLSYGKYVTLIVLVLILPYYTTEPWFSKLCPVGTLEAGIPQVLYNADLRELVGTIFGIKILILIGFLVWMVLSSRPFCRTACPLGAIYSLFNRISFLRIEVDQERCINCYKCYRVCPVGVKIHEDGSANTHCIRCQRCTECPAAAVKISFTIHHST